jgi:hypothetical protein
MNKTGPDTSGASHGGPDDVPPETVLPLGTRQQGSAARRHPRHHLMWVFAAAGAAAAAALAAGVIVALHTAPGAPSPAAAPSPLAAVTSALARTSAGSYAFSLDSTVQFAGKDLHSDVVSGTFDPRHDLGTELLTNRSAGQTERAQVRFIGAYLYTWVSPRSGFGKPWDESPLAAATANGMPSGDLYGFVSDQPVSPGALTVVLRSADTAVHVVSSPGWTGTKYTFTARLYDGQESVSGAVYVDQQGRIRRLMTITTQQRRGAKSGLTTDRDITFSDFGAPARVSAPPASQVKYTSGEPYWGFYF